MLRSTRAALLTFTALSTLPFGCTARDAAGEADAIAAYGGDNNPCTGEPRTRAVSWTERTTLGRSASEAFAAIAGTCAAPFTWEVTVLNDRTVAPRRAESEMTVTVEFDESSARLVRPPEGAPESVCPSFLEVGAKVRLRSADGTFDEMGTTTARYASDAGALPLAFDVPLGKQGGNLTIELGKNETGALRYTLDGASESCAGQIEVTISASEPGSASRTHAGGPIGQWSNTGCPLGEQHIDLTTPRGNAPSLTDQLVELWGDATYHGTWEDGQKTTLSVKLAVSAKSACGTEREVNIPVEVTWGTADGRIVMHEVAANVHVGQDVELGLWVSDEMTCKDRLDTLDYTRASCADVESLTLQLGLNSYGRGNVEVAGEGVQIYSVARGGKESPDLGQLRLTIP